MGKKRSKGLSPKEYEAFLAKIRKKLIKLREECSENLESSLEGLRNREGLHVSEEEIEPESTDDIVVSQLLEMGATKIQEIDQALKKIEEKTYGYCEECGKFIGKERLNALPFVSLCVDCKRQQERQERGGNLYYY